MNLLIGLLIIIFIVLTVLVIGRTQSLLRRLKGDGELEAQGTGPLSQVDNTNSANGFAFLVFWIVSAIGLIWSFNVYKGSFLPEASSVHGKETDFLFWVSMTVIIIAFFIVNSVLFFFCYKYGYDKNRKASFYPHNNTLEVIWTVIPALVMTGLVFTGLRVWTKTMAEAPADAEVVEIMGKQFAWAARYPGKDNKLGDYSYKLMDDAGGNNFGIDLADKASFDDFTNSTEFHIPKGKPVLLKIRSRDVLHSFFIPHMRVKMDAVPGMPTKFWFIADKSTDEMRTELNNPDFNYEVACAEVCGKSHFGMKFILIVDEPEQYNKWKSEQKPFLTMFPDYIEKVPQNLREEARKYLPVEETVAEVVTPEAAVEEVSSESTK